MILSRFGKSNRNPKASDSTAQRRWVVDPICALILLGCIAGHLLHFGNGETLSRPDSYVYREQAAHPLTDSRFWIGKAPPLYPLWYKAVGAGEFGANAVLAAQTALSLLAFTLLAFACARTAHTRAGRRLLFALPLVVSLAPLVAKWNQMVLSESLSVSLFAVFVAAWYLHLHRPNWWTLAAIAVSAACWAAVRDTNAYTVLMFVPIAVLAGVGGRRKAVALCIALVAAFAVANIVESRSERRMFSLYNVVGQRILPHPTRVEFFVSGGMPFGSALAERSGKWADGDDFAFLHDLRLQPFREWAANEGTATYMRFLLAHPFHSLAAPAAEIGETFLNYLGWAVNMDFSLPSEPLPPWLAGILRWAVVLGYGAAVLSALALWRRGRFHEAPWLLVPLGMALLSAPQLWLAWHGDAMEVLRHGLTAVVSFLLGGLLLVAAIADRFLATRDSQARIPSSKTSDGCLHRMVANHRLSTSAASLLAVAAWLVVAQLARPERVERGETLYRQLENRRPLQMASDWNIHAIANDRRDSVSGLGWTLVYTKTPCTERDFDALFYLHVWPQDAADLSPHRAVHGYENLDFSCTAALCWRIDDRCVATAYVPDYPIGRMYTGQYRVVDGSIQPIWAGAEFTLPANTRATE